MLGMYHKRCLLALTLLLLTYPRDAWAYLDPGTGSMLLQVLVAVGAGAILILKTHWRRLMTWLKRRHDRPTEPPSELSGDAKR